MSKALLLVFVCLSLILALCYRFTQTGTGNAMVSGKWVFTLMAGAIFISLILALYHLVTTAVGVYQQSNRYDAAMVFTSFIAFIPIVLVARLLLVAAAVPSIHDITTDTDNPPIFKYALAARQSGDNSLDYSPALAGQQRAAYPHIQPLLLQHPPLEVITMVNHIIERMGWAVHGSYQHEAATYIEAYDKTAMVGFIDDLVLRVSTREGGHTQVDMRSVSRIGVSDLGANAQRIEAFMAQLQEQARH